MNTISFGQALDHCLSTASYVGWLIAAAIIFIAVLFWVVKNRTVLGTAHAIAFFLSLTLLFACFYVRPNEIHNNTTQEQADRGVYIGY